MLKGGGGCGHDAKSTLGLFASAAPEIYFGVSIPFDHLRTQTFIFSQMYQLSFHFFYQFLLISTVTVPENCFFC